MSQLTAVTQVTNGSQAVVIPGVNLASQILVNFMFMVAGELVPYTVAANATFDGTNTHFNLTGNYLGATNATASGVVVTGYTYPDNIPVISQGDVGTAAVFTDAMYRIQDMLGSVSSGGLASMAAYAAEVAADRAIVVADTATVVADTATVVADTATTVAAAAAAASSATAAAASAASLTTGLASFNSKWLGSHATDPTLDGSGNALAAGAEYYNTVSHIIRTYSGSAWGDYDADAVTATTNAGISATAAAVSQGAAATSATNAAASATTATTQATNAGTSATSASGSATAASGSATAAAGSATAASGSATAASGSATAASGSASTATTQAGAASTSATGAAAAQTAAEAARDIAKAQAGSALFNFETSTTDAIPAAGAMRLNNATLSAVTAAYINNADRSGATVTGLLDALATSTSTNKAIITFREGTTGKVAYYNLTGSVVDGTGYRKLTLAFLSSSTGGFTAANVIGLNWALSGNQGTAGTGSGDFVGPSSSVDGEVVVFNGATGKLGKRMTGTGIAYLLNGVMTAIASVSGTVLTGLSLATSTAITATNTVLEALGLLQAQITAHGTTIAAHGTAITANTTAIALKASLTGVEQLTNKTLVTPVISTIQSTSATATIWNPADKGTSVTLSNGNLTTSSNYTGAVRSNAGMSSGKWYWEWSGAAGNMTNQLLGIALASAPINGLNIGPGSVGSDNWGIYFGDGKKYINNVGTTYVGGAIPTSAVIGCYLDMDAGTCGFTINGVDKGIAWSGLTGTIYPYAGGGSSGAASTITANFGATAFTYSPPSGYTAGAGAAATFYNLTVPLSTDTLVGKATTDTLTNKTLTAPAISAPVLTGAIASNGSVRRAMTAVSALNLDCSLGNYFTKTIAANSTFTFSNPPASVDFTMQLKLVHTSGTVTWPTVLWPNGVAPTLTTGKVHRFWFSTDDGGTTWRATSLINYAS